MLSRILFIFRWLFLAIFCCLLILCLYVYIPVIKNPTNSYAERKGKIVSVNMTRQWQAKHSQYEELNISASSDLTLELLVRRPLNQVGPLPVAVLLGGINTGRKACELIPRLEHVICVSLSYPGYSPDAFDGAAFFYRIHDVQEMVKDTPPAVLLALDYLVIQSYVDKQHIELVGVSLGAFFVAVPAVLDQRFSRVWLAQGAAQPIKVIHHNFLQRVDSDLLGSIFSPLIGYAIGSHFVAPEKWVGKIAPREVIFINAKHDLALPDSSVVALHNAAKQPTQVIWTHGGHVTPGRKEVIQQLTDIVLTRIANK